MPAKPQITDDRHGFMQAFRHMRAGLRFRDLSDDEATVLSDRFTDLSHELHRQYPSLSRLFDCVLTELQIENLARVDPDELEEVLSK